MYCAHATQFVSLTHHSFHLLILPLAPLVILCKILLFLLFYKKVSLLLEGLKENLVNLHASRGQEEDDNTKLSQEGPGDCFYFCALQSPSPTLKDVSPASLGSHPGNVTARLVGCICS